MEEFFINPVVRTLLGLGCCFWLASQLVKRISILQRLAIPISILAGAIGFLIRLQFPELMDVDVLKPLVYHGLALVFISVGLQIQHQASMNRDAVSIGFAISTMGGFQGVLGALVVMVLSVVIAEQVHPGIGLLLPLGFNQGPGQALSFGRAWEASGLQSGGDLGIIIAAIGFVWSILLGIPLVQYARRKGWVEEETKQYSKVEEDSSVQVKWVQHPETILNSIVLVVITYTIVFLLLSGVTSFIVGKEKLVNMLWGLHFIIALFVSMGIGHFLKRGMDESTRTSHNQRLQMLNNLSVDLTTASGLVAIQVAVLSENMGLILVLTTLGGFASLGFALLLYRRVFRTLPLHHLILWLGACTGTFPMGLALLRMIDPNLSSAAPVNFTRGAALALLTSTPSLVILGYAIGNYPENYPTAGWATLGLMGTYLIVLLIIWRKIAWVRVNVDT